MDNTGKTLDFDARDGEVIERPTTPEEELTAKGMFKGIKDILAAISAAVSGDQITSRQAQEMRTRLGIHQSYFTRSKMSAKKRAVRKRMQKASRKANRRKTKGLLNRKGQRYTKQT